MSNNRSEDRIFFLGEIADMTNSSRYYLVEDDPEFNAVKAQVLEMLKGAFDYDVVAQGIEQMRKCF